MYSVKRYKNDKQKSYSLEGHAYIKCLVISTAAGLSALLHVLCVAPLLEGLPGHVLLDILALLPGGGSTLPAGGAGAVLLIYILSDGGGDTAANLVRDIIADFTWGGDVITDLLGNLVTLPAGDSRALTLGDLLGLDPGHQGADTPGLLLAVPDGNLLAGLAVELLAVDLGHLGAPHLGDVGALLAGELAALTLRDSLTVGLWDVLAFLLLHGLALPLIDIIADLLGHLAALLLGLLGALLGGDVTADLGVVNLLAHLAGHRVADLSVHSVALLLIAGGALLTGYVPALLFGNQGTLPLVDNTALLGWNIFADFILDGLALPLIDDLALGLGPSGALLLHDGGALLLVPGAALLVKLGRAFLLMDGLLNSPGKVDALHLGDRVAFLLELLLTSLLDVIGSLAILLVLEAALLAGDSLLDRFLGDLALALLDISTHGVGDIMALPPGDGVIHGLGNLFAELLGDLAAHGLRGSCPDHGRGVTLEGDLEESQEKGVCEDSLHLE